MSLLAALIDRMLFRNPMRSFIFISAAWYFALYPGRLGFDYSEAIRIMQRGESTSWWTSSYWWFLKITSFDGRSIAVSSLITLAILGFSMVYLCRQLPIEQSIKDKSLVFFSLTPLYGAFGVTVSHDVFLTSSIILFTSLQIRLYLGNNKLHFIDLFALGLATVAAITTHYGIFIVIVNVLTFLLLKNSWKFVLVIPSAFLIIQISTIGVTQVPTFGPVLPMIADIKCVTQHPQADISDLEWQYLISKAPKEEWLVPTSCAMVDTQLGVMPSLELEKIKLDSELIMTYLKVIGKNAAIPAMAHFQRASVALPPPFFAGQPNQVILDPSVPIGEGTNTALQTNAEVLHPSIDEPSMDKKIIISKPFEIVAQGMIFTINQASWFWGWGGLWLWPFVAFVFFHIKTEKKQSIAPILCGTFTLHLLLLVFSAPLPRYVMSTILMGLYFGITWSVKFLAGYQNKL